jgi:phage I-like protein
MAKMTKAQKISALDTLSEGNGISPDALALAGVEVKLTKSEIAEYISAKAIAKIKTEMAALDAKHNWYSGKLEVKDIPERLAVFTESLNKMRLYNSFPYQVYLGIGEADILGSKLNWRVESHNAHEGITLTFEKTDTVPPEYTQFVEDKKRYQSLRMKHAELSQKNYKILLVEKILSGSIEGKTVLANLNQMVAEMVA